MSLVDNPCDFILSEIKKGLGICSVSQDCRWSQFSLMRNSIG